MITIGLSSIEDVCPYAPSTPYFSKIAEVVDRVGRLKTFPSVAYAVLSTRLCWLSCRFHLFEDLYDLLFSVSLLHSWLLVRGNSSSFWYYLEGPDQRSLKFLWTKSNPAPTAIQLELSINHLKQLIVIELPYSTSFRIGTNGIRSVPGIAAIKAIDALNFHPHLHGLLADGYWKDGVFTRFLEVALKAIEEVFAERVLSQLHKHELISDDNVAQILSQDHTGLGKRDVTFSGKRDVTFSALPHQGPVVGLRQILGPDTR